MACHATYARFDGPAPAHRIRFDDARQGYPAALSTLWVKRGFQRLLEIAALLPTCGHRFERESGYWVGAVIFNTAFAIGSFPLTFGLVLWLTWPDVPWDLLTPVVIAVTALVPILMYPWSQTLWMAYDLYVHPLEPDEIGAARERLEAKGS